MAVIAPSGLVVTNASSTTNNLTWNNGQSYDTVSIIRNEVPYDSVGGTEEEYSDTSISINTNYTYKVIGIKGGEASDPSNEDSAAYWTASATETVTVMDSKTVTVAFSISATESVTTTDEYSADVEPPEAPEPQQYEVEATETVICTDSYELSVMSAQTSKYYLLSSDGKVYEYGDDYESDAGATISCFWETKSFDFADLYPQFADAWKTINRITLTYVDKGEARVGLAVSTNDGTTWTEKYKTIGNGAGTVKDAIYDFYLTGRFFRFKIMNASTSGQFQWIRLTVEFDVGAEWFKVD